MLGASLSRSLMPLARGARSNFSRDGYATCTVEPALALMDDVGLQQSSSPASAGASTFSGVSMLRRDARTGESRAMDPRSHEHCRGVQPVVGEADGGVRVQGAGPALGSFVGHMKEDEAPFGGRQRCRWCRRIDPGAVGGLAYSAPLPQSVRLLSNGTKDASFGRLAIPGARRTLERMRDRRPDLLGHLTSSSVSRSSGR